MYCCQAWGPAYVKVNSRELQGQTKLYDICKSQGHFEFISDVVIHPYCHPAICLYLYSHWFVQGDQHPKISKVYIIHDFNVQEIMIKSMYWSWEIAVIHLNDLSTIMQAIIYCIKTS